MCGRYIVASEEDILEMRAIMIEINERYRNTQLHAEMKTVEVFPTCVAPVITDDGAKLMHWGMSKWDGKGVIINARAETAPVKRMFKDALSSRRCVVPSTGFFEWSHGVGPKKKYLCRLPNAPMLLMAGIYNIIKDADGSPSYQYVILTTAPSKSIAVIHDRMPVILQPGEEDIWISNANATMDILNRPGPELELTEAGGTANANRKMDSDHVQISYLGSDGSSGS